MPIIVFGLNHRSAPLEVREKLTFPATGLAGALGRLSGLQPVHEAMILSTCNRTELLGRISPNGTGDPAATFRQFLATERKFPCEELDRYCYRMVDGEAIHHLFRVAASLDSMVLGEAQVLGQVKAAYEAALRANCLGDVLNPLLRKALGVAKRVRTETGIARHPVSISHAAVSLARTIFEDLEGRRILLIGAGKMSELAARHLMERGIRTVFVANRNYPRAVELARSFHGEAVHFDRIFDYLQEVDIVISSTAAPHHILKFEDVSRLIRFRMNRPIFFIDIALPRDIDPRANTIDNVYLYDMDDLSGVISANRAERAAEAKLAEQIVLREAEAFYAWTQTLNLSPVIVGLRNKMDHLRQDELKRFEHRLAGLTSEQRKTVEEMTGAFLNKILHDPIRALKNAVQKEGGSDRVRFFREIFAIDESSEQKNDDGEASPTDPPTEHK